MKKILILGGCGFIGGNLSKKLTDEGHFVRNVDIKRHEFFTTFNSEWFQGDLTDPRFVFDVMSLPEGSFDEVYQLAADMGGAGYIFTGENDAKIMHNSAMINLNVLDSALRTGVKKIFFSSSACVYPEHNQLDPNNPNCEESSAYPANPDSEYGWEKLFSERLYMSYHKNYGLDIRIARFHNIFGPYGTYKGGKEKAPAALCRKVVESIDGGEIEIWGDGKQTRSFLYIDECLDGVRRLMDSDFIGPVNIGSDEMISINELAQWIIDISGKMVHIKNISGPTGVRGRNSDNKLIKDKLNWSPSNSLYDGLTKTYSWIKEQIEK
jgi:nucleoside-diphosphate-sugar epimerase